MLILYAKNHIDLYVHSRLGYNSRMDSIDDRMIRGHGEVVAHVDVEMSVAELHRDGTLVWYGGGFTDPVETRMTAKMALAMFAGDTVEVLTPKLESLRHKGSRFAAKKSPSASAGSGIYHIEVPESKDRPQVSTAISSEYLTARVYAACVMIMAACGGVSAGVSLDSEWIFASAAALAFAARLLLGRAANRL